MVILGFGWPPRSSEDVAVAITINFVIIITTTIGFTVLGSGFRVYYPYYHHYQGTLMLCFATASMTWRRCLTCARTVSAFGSTFLG